MGLPVVRLVVPSDEAATFKYSRKRPVDSASLGGDPKSADFQYERPDWVLFRSIDTLSQKAGVKKDLLRRLVLKELVDNALDAGGHVSISQTECGYRIEDDGLGIGGTPQDIARLFSINRPLVSSKLLRMPTRGALGNGLRVVSGAALYASEGSLIVTTRGLRHVLTNRDDGSAAIESSEVDFPVGTRIDISFGTDIPADEDNQATLWADNAIKLAKGDTYAGKPSPWWYDDAQFYELLQAAGDRPLREMISQMDGCTGAKAGKIVGAFKSMQCRALSRKQAVEVLLEARRQTKPVRPERLGAVGEVIAGAYKCIRGNADIGSRAPLAKVPFVIEVWASLSKSKDRSSVQAYVNRTPITGDVHLWRDQKSVLGISGCGLNEDIRAPAGAFRVHFNIITPYCPITTDGKEPDFSCFADDLLAAITSAIRKAKSAAAPKQGEGGKTNLKAVVLAHLDECIAKASGDGKYRFSQRQLFYVVRPFVIEELGKELEWNYFTGLVTDYEDQNGDVPGMYRDARGTLYHPHLGQDIAVGTLAVEQYERPAWSFNKVLFVEKEGFFEVLKAARWPERNDCALLSSKGYSSRAVRDLLDLIANDDEPMTCFCVHDADAFGTMIYQTLQEETKARKRRLVEIINLGLEPWEALEMGLDPEPHDKGKAKVADYIVDRPDGERWCEWFSERRVELNAMTTPQFIEWLDRKMSEHSVGKVVPPCEVIVDTLKTDFESRVRERISSRILAEARLDDRVAEAVGAVDLPSEVQGPVESWLRDNPHKLWSGWAKDTADDLSDIADAA